MRKGLYIVFAVLTVTIAFGACGKDEPATVDDATTRGAGAQDFTKGGGITVDTAWAGETHINF